MKHLVSIAIAVIATVLGHSASALAQTNRPNILVIFGDDIGINNISAYGRHPSKGNTPSPGQAVGRTPAVRRRLSTRILRGWIPQAALMPRPKAAPP